MGKSEMIKRAAKFILKGVPVINNTVYVKVLSCDRKDAFAYRHVLITGGSSGIGYAIAEKILKGGGKVCVTGRDRLKLETAQKRLGEGCKTLVFDIADIGKIQHMLYQAIEQLGGKLDTVVSNAGIFYEKSFCDYTSEDWERICNINLAGGVLFGSGSDKVLFE